ncbi:PHD finger protein 14 [Methylocaldum marinum]|uniref:PHD finger protein 14 n=1 Tax=Methylocaldum marinum TaxID=1432792 RepID=A0A250KRX7_9GAMM|nr:hypothetical protein [Methylocaldum marinum]BBA34322.1 PHD finger protein 14 [Methylocaldum marinum]
MVEIHPVEHVGPLPAAKKVRRDENREQRKSDSPKQQETGAAEDEVPPHVDEYA